MNNFIARAYSGTLELVHMLFLLAMIIFTIYVFKDPDETGLTVRQIMLVYATAFVTWIVIFGFITTIVVMAGTLTDIKEQNRAMVAFLQEIATAGSDVTPEALPAARATRSYDEPFLVAGDIRK